MQKQFMHKKTKNVEKNNLTVGIIGLIIDILVNGLPHRRTNGWSACF